MEDVPTLRQSPLNHSCRRRLIVGPARRIFQSRSPKPSQFWICPWATWPANFGALMPALRRQRWSWAKKTRARSLASQLLLKIARGSPTPHHFPIDRVPVMLLLHPSRVIALRTREMSRDKGRLISVGGVAGATIRIILFCNEPSSRKKSATFWLVFYTSFRRASW